METCQALKNISNSHRGKSYAILLDYSPVSSPVVFVPEVWLNYTARAAYLLHFGAAFPQAT